MKPSDCFGEKAWQLPRRPDPLSTLMWRCEQDPALRPALVLVVLLDRAPDPRRFVAGHEWATRMIPRLRDRLVAPLLTPTMPIWAPDPEFELARHVHRAGLAQPAGRRELLDLAGRLATAPFDLNRPLWESTLVEDLREEAGPHRAAWLLKVHHCMADGPLLAFWLGTLLSRDRAPRTGKPQPPAPPRLLDTPLTQYLAGPLAEEAAPAAQRLARGTLAAVRTPVRRTLEAANLAYKLVEVTTRPAGKPSPLLRSRGSGRRLEGLEIELDRLRATARSVGVSVNAAYCAGLLTGLRLYHEAHGVTVASVSAAMTMPVRRTGPRTGNRFNGGKFAGRLDEKDPQALCRCVERQLAHVAPPFPPAALDTVLTCVNQLPTTLLMPLARSLGRSHDLQISHVVGFGRDTYVSGARVEQVWGFGPAPGCAVMALMISRRHSGTVALTLDCAAIPDPSTFVTCIEQGFAEVIGGSGRCGKVASALELMYGFDG